MNTMGALEYYKELKAIHTDPVFGLDPAFPDWKTWLEDYKKEYYADRVVVTDEEADAILEEVIETSEKELGLPDGDETFILVPPGYVDVADVEDEQETLHMDTTELVDEVESVVPDVEEPVVEKAPHKKKTVAKKKAVVKKAAPKRGRPAKSKADLARTIFKRIGHKERKKVISAFVEKAGLTPAGAATYYQKFKTEGV